MKLYYCDINDLNGTPGVELLDGDRRARFERLRMPKAKARCLAAGLMLRAVLGDDALRIETGEHGKPFIDGGPCFSVSHSGDYVLLAVSPHEIGTDIQRISRWNEGVARRCFTEDELQWLFGQTEQSAFYKLWTAKESVMKGCGLGFSMPPGSFSVLPVADGEHHIGGREWHLRWQELNGYMMCTACESSFPAVYPQRLQREQLLKGR